MRGFFQVRSQSHPPSCWDHSALCCRECRNIRDFTFIRRSHKQFKVFYHVAVAFSRFASRLPNCAEHRSRCLFLRLSVSFWKYSLCLLPVAIAKPVFFTPGSDISSAIQTITTAAGLYSVCLVVMHPCISAFHPFPGGYSIFLLCQCIERGDWIWDPCCEILWQRRRSS